jgi:hypothetical protein
MSKIVEDFGFEDETLAANVNTIFRVVAVELGTATLKEVRRYDSKNNKLDRMVLTVELEAHNIDLVITHRTGKE